MADDEKDILRIVRDQEAAIGRGDAEAAISALAADVVTYDLPPPLEYRGAGTRAVDGLREWFATWEDGVMVEMKDPQVVINGDLAVAFGLALMSTPVAIVAYLALPTAWTVLTMLVDSLDTTARWLNLDRAMGPLLDGQLDATAWAQLGTSTAVWVLLPLAVGLWRTARRDVS